MWERGGETDGETLFCSLWKESYPQSHGTPTMTPNAITPMQDPIYTESQCDTQTNSIDCIATIFSLLLDQPSSFRLFKMMTCCLES